MKFDVSYYSSHGGRSENEDSMFINENGNEILAIVADGLGGCKNGREASLKAVNIISSVKLTENEPADILAEAFSTANAELLRESDQLTTAAALYIRGDAACAAHVGDSRIYQFRDRQIISQSLDHSVSQMAVFAGEITKEQIRGHCDRSKLVRVLGRSDNVSPDISALTVLPGDAFLLCSDGFWELITENEMIAARTDTKTAAEWLTKMRKIIENKIHDNSDNNTAIVIMAIS